MLTSQELSTETPLKTQAEGAEKLVFALSCYPKRRIDEQLSVLTGDSRGELAAARRRLRVAAAVAYVEPQLQPQLPERSSEEPDSRRTRTPRPLECPEGRARAPGGPRARRPPRARVRERYRQRQLRVLAGPRPPGATRAARGRPVGTELADDD